MTDPLKLSLDGSIFIQIVTLILNLFAFTVPLDKWDFALKEILGLETLVQTIELLFYGWYRGNIVDKVSDVTQFRYYDWFFTTPMMLFSTASFYGYTESKEKETKKPFSVVDFYRENSSWILLMFICNAFMLMFGYLQELGMISITTSSIFGYLSLLGSFSILYKFVARAQTQQFLFKIMFFLWSLYGVAAALPVKEKNISYNVLDIFAKNFYGVFLSYLIYKRRV